MILFSSDQIVPERRLSKPQPFRELIGELSGEVNEAYVLYVAYGPQNEELDYTSLESSGMGALVRMLAHDMRRSPGGKECRDSIEIGGIYHC